MRISDRSSDVCSSDLDVDARFVDLTLWDEDDMRSLDARIEEAFAAIDLGAVLPIVTGYAGCEGGMVRRYARGYTEMTFSRIAEIGRASCRERVVQSLQTRWSPAH